MDIFVIFSCVIFSILTIIFQLIFNTYTNTVSKKVVVKQLMLIIFISPMIEIEEINK